MAVVDQGRMLAGLGSLDGRSQTLPKLYALAATPSMYAANFHDITSGNNGYAATTGYDAATGIGTPIGAKLITSLAALPTWVTSFAAGAPVVSGSVASLSATVLPSSGGTVTGVAFYRESNSTAGLQTTGTADTLVGNGTLSNGTWKIDASTTGLPRGTYTFYALATDSLGSVSAAAGVTQAVQQPLQVAASTALPEKGH